MREEARTDFDYHVAVFLRDVPDRIAELYRLADLSTAILADGWGFIHAMAYPAGRAAYMAGFHPRRPSSSKPAGAFTKRILASTLNSIA
jgi:hypothetical protein